MNNENEVVISKEEFDKLQSLLSLQQKNVDTMFTNNTKLRKENEELRDTVDRLLTMVQMYRRLLCEAGDKMTTTRKETADKILKDIMFCIDINDCNKNEMLILNLCKMLAIALAITFIDKGDDE